MLILQRNQVDIWDSILPEQARILPEELRKDVKKQILAIAKLLPRRPRETWEDIKEITERVAHITEEVINEAKTVVELVKDKGRVSVISLKEQLTEAINLTQKLVEQAFQRFALSQRLLLLTEDLVVARTSISCMTEGLDASVSLPRAKRANSAKNTSPNRGLKTCKDIVQVVKLRSVCLNNKYGLNRSRYRGFAGTKTWVGLGILVHNLNRAAKMVA